MRRLAIALVVFLAAGGAMPGHAGAADKPRVDLAARKAGPSTGLPLPRFVSLKADEVNVRRGPGWDHAIAWVFRRAGLPVEVIAEFDVWRQVRDSEGATGWVVGSLLSGRRTVLVAPWEAEKGTIDMHEGASRSSRVSARLSPGVLGDVKECDGSWCRILIGGVSGYIAQDAVWGAYPGETVDQ